MISFRARYINFKEDYSRVGLGSIYCFNGFSSVIDYLNKTHFNSSKISSKGLYYMDCEDGEKFYMSKGLLDMW